MAQYDKKILNSLLDSYEKSLLFTGKNKVNIRISFPFTAASVPEYFDESSLAYEELHIRLKELEQKGYIRIIWKKENHIIRKVILEEGRIIELYRFLKRLPKVDSVGNTLKLLEDMKPQCDTPICAGFIAWLSQRIEEDEPVKEYIDLAQPEQTARLLQAITGVEKNREDCYIREFSIRHFSDSKIMDGLLGLIGKIMRRFGGQFAEMDVYSILAEYSIYHTPNYIYVKGDSGLLHLADSRIALKGLRQGIGISGEDLPKMTLSSIDQIKKVITIENLTTFFSWQEPDSILIYLGGYHNSVRRTLLSLLYAELPDARYLHFGDIDAGGFEIYEDLCRKTGIAFQPYYMNVETLKAYQGYAKKLSLNDRKRIEKMLKQDGDCGYRDVLVYMLAENVKLEQECIIRKNRLKKY